MSTNGIAEWNTYLIGDRAITPIWIEEPLGNPWWYDGAPISIVSYEESGQIVTYDPSKNIPETKLAKFRPEDLYDLIDWSLLRPVYQYNKSNLEKISNGLMIALVVILLFFVYLLYSSQTGG